MSDNFAEAVRLFSNAKSIVALTGAGISVPSGIADFRSPGGVWERYDMEEYGTIDSFIHNPHKVWELFDEFDSLICSAAPNPAHLALSELQKRGKLTALITQNIDGLHQKAGTTNIIEFHGNCTKLHCIFCQREYERTEAKRKSKNEVPLCECGKPLKPTVVLFGEQIPRNALERAFIATDRADLFVVIGTSATVAPASNFPYFAKQRGVPVIEINLMSTVLTDSLADITLLGSVDEVLPKLVRAIDSAT